MEPRFELPHLNPVKGDSYSGLRWTGTALRGPGDGRNGKWIDKRSDQSGAQRPNLGRFNQGAMILHHQGGADQRALVQKLTS